MATCYLWVIAMSEQTADQLIIGLVRKGYAVEPLSSGKNPTIPGEVSTTIALQVGNVEGDKKGKTERGPHQVLLEVAKDLLKSLNYYAVIAYTVGGGFTWNGSNITLPKPDSRPTALDRVAGDNPLDEAS